MSYCRKCGCMSVRIVCDDCYMDKINDENVLLKATVTKLERKLARINKDNGRKHIMELFTRLIKEIPAKAVIYKTANNLTYTTRDMLNLIKSKDEDGIARAYCSDILRVTRDLLSRKADQTKKY